ncbi:unnamed protein product [Polarella glacialis]|uniref:Uncharacterized protein n=1 Tax=Polarella glacialis TaxID=89957 RepID=A0A813GVL2_POLGL|nr:unnamed protein product [Polarella glacialis]
MASFGHTALEQASLARTRSQPAGTGFVSYQSLGAGIVHEAHGQTRIRGWPMRDPQRAAGAPSGGPVKRDFLSKFDKREGRVREDPNGLCQYSLARGSWQTMKYDMNWSAYNDIARPHSHSDLTGFPKLYMS